ncbi:MAG: twin-arginine translocase TatA/TatE family subunit [Flavobacteriales bacterium CG_4_8_14_3_um_filter_35_10]|nr:MAG: Sec-independent protein translocase TatA [Flavobacteriaceae bacterium CG1_02_35_72]PIX05877.1 MAG: twin-arginine translocase TatA/TatE family subunit [Flavobacteriales bacterium CG_4_8_14_3_um_filter_35_10]PJA06995.1 MAG: twin-arginine translocase TatA/TatE family subunit [Flavobacteriales bacterium CG_4_10_14_0_2_um_filter_35_18]
MIGLTIILGMVGGPQVLVILAVAILFFGGKKIPELMKGLGQGIKEFKNATKDTETPPNKLLK